MIKLPTLDEVKTRPGRAFANGFEHDCWDTRWCAKCHHDLDFRYGRTDQGCPILAAALLGSASDEEVIPEAWVVDQPNRLGCFYRCKFFQEAE